MITYMPTHPSSALPAVCRAACNTPHAAFLSASCGRHMPYPVGSRNIGALLGLIETCIWLYMSQLNSLLLLLTEDYLEPCRSMLCPV